MSAINEFYIFNCNVTLSSSQILYEDINKHLKKEKLFHINVIKISIAHSMKKLKC